MLTADELSTIPLFSPLPAAGLADLARGAADIHLKPGEYAAHEGDEAALFVVLTGGFEAIKLVDGIERKIGMRMPGRIFGEVPLIYGTQFQASFRAAEPSRVLKVDGQQYYALAALSPEFARRFANSRRSASVGCRALPPSRARRG